MVPSVVTTERIPSDTGPRDPSCDPRHVSTNLASLAEGGSTMWPEPSGKNRDAAPPSRGVILCLLSLQT